MSENDKRDNILMLRIHLQAELRAAVITDAVYNALVFLLEEKLDEK